MPIVSVIIPVYNIAPYLEKCIDSIRNQTYKDLEIILVDDGSTDGSGKLCDLFVKADSRIKVLHQSNKGVVAARGLGIAHAMGKYLSFIDGDDYIEPGMIQYLVEHIGDADLVSSGALRYVAPNQMIRCTDNYEVGLYEGSAYDVVLQNMIYDCRMDLFQSFTPWMVTKLFRRELVQALYPKLDSNIRYAEDAIFVYLYLSNCSSVVITKECFYHYLYRETSACHTENDSMLMDINRGYLVLKDEFAGHALEKSLSFQLQKWVVKSICLAINKHMGFDVKCSIPEFIVDASDLKGKRIVLYGAGTMGKNYKKQLEQMGCEIVLWVDKDCLFYKEQGLNVEAPETILDVFYDIVLVAVSREETVKEIFESLQEAGVKKNKILWRKPRSVF